LERRDEKGGIGQEERKGSADADEEKIRVSRLAANRDANFLAEAFGCKWLHGGYFQKVI